MSVALKQIEQDDNNIFDVHEHRVDAGMNYVRALLAQYPGIINFRTGAGRIYFGFDHNLPVIPGLEDERTMLCRQLEQCIYPLLADMYAQAVDIKLTISSNSSELRPPTVVGETEVFLVLDAAQGCLRRVILPPYHALTGLAGLSIATGIIIEASPINPGYHRLYEDRGTRPQNAASNLPNRYMDNRFKDPEIPEEVWPPLSQAVFDALHEVERTALATERDHRREEARLEKLEEGLSPISPDDQHALAAGMAIHSLVHGFPHAVTTSHAASHEEVRENVHAAAPRLDRRKIESRPPARASAPPVARATGRPASPTVQPHPTARAERGRPAKPQKRPRPVQQIKGAHPHVSPAHTPNLAIAGHGQTLAHDAQAHPQTPHLQAQPHSAAAHATDIHSEPAHLTGAHPEPSHTQNAHPAEQHAQPHGPEAAHNEPASQHGAHQEAAHAEPAEARHEQPAAKHESHPQETAHEQSHPEPAHTQTAEVRPEPTAKPEGHSQQTATAEKSHSTPAQTKIAEAHAEPAAKLATPTSAQTSHEPPLERRTIKLANQEEVSPNVITAVATTATPAHARLNVAEMQETMHASAYVHLLDVPAHHHVYDKLQPAKEGPAPDPNARQFAVASLETKMVSQPQVTPVTAPKIAPTELRSEPKLKQQRLSRAAFMQRLLMPHPGVEMDEEV